MKNNKNYSISIELNDNEQQKFDEWKAHIKAIYGEYGLFTWKIIPTGIGSGIVVYSHNTKTELDLTDIDSW
jgi:hypothetical protein